MFGPENEDTACEFEIKFSLFQLQAMRNLDKEVKDSIKLNRTDSFSSQVGNVDAMSQVPRRTGVISKRIW